jgi:diaminopimelate decarboxylase
MAEPAAGPSEPRGFAAPSAAPSPWPRDAVWSERGLEIRGAGAGDLAAAHGTPLIVVDADEIERRMRVVAAAYPRAAYAVKAFTASPVIRLALDAGLDLLCASGGEVEACLRAGAPAERIVLHGNAKTDAELELVVSEGVGLVVADGLDELRRLDAVAAARGVVQPFLLRVVPEVAVDTHEAIATGHELSKFGTPRADAVATIVAAAGLANLRYDGLHAHAGSQVLDPSPYLDVLASLVELARGIREVTGGPTGVLDVGGGFGVTYVGEAALDPATLAPRLLARLDELAREAEIDLPVLVVEPGRSLVANAALTLYRVVARKRVGGRSLVAVDGGMSDNLRPMLYDASYAVAPVEARAGEPTEPVTVVGRHCESGDVLAERAEVPRGLAAGDLVAFAATGAYGYSLASGYNRIGRPAVVAVRDGDVVPWLRREDAADLDRLEVGPSGTDADDAAPPAGVTVRRATPRDAASALDLWRAVIAEGRWVRSDDVAQPVREWRRRFARAIGDDAIELVAVDGRVVGHLGLTRERHPAARHVATLAVVVAEDRRGEGIGTGLLAEAIRWARRAGVEKLVLSVYPSNRRAIALYRRFGFREEGRLSRHSRKPYGYEDEILMARWVGDR